MASPSWARTAVQHECRASIRFIGARREELSRPRVDAHLSERRAVSAKVGDRRWPTTLKTDEWQTGYVNIGEDLLEQRRQRRRSGDPRLSPEGREILRRLVTGDLVGEFQGSLEAVSDVDPVLGGETDAEA